METPTSPIPTPDPVQPALAEIKKDWPWAVIIIVALVLTNLFCGYSWKQTTDKLTQLQASHSESVTITEPVEVAGKIVYKTTTQTVHDTQTVTVHDKTVTEIKSGVSLGLGFDVNLNPALMADADLLPLGPGNIQGWASGSKSDQMAGLAYRLNF